MLHQGGNNIAQQLPTNSNIHTNAWITHAHTLTLTHSQMINPIQWFSGIGGWRMCECG